MGARKRSTAFWPRCAEQFVHDPEHAAGRLVGFLAQDFPPEACHGRHAVLRFTTSEDLGAVDIPSGEVDPGNVAPRLSATRPCEMTCCLISAIESRDNGSPRG
jgi:hypothetical protein